MRRRRSLQCRKILSNVFANLTDVKRARVTLGVCQDTVNFIWSEGEIAYIQKQSNNTSGMNSNNGIIQNSTGNDYNVLAHHQNSQSVDLDALTEKNHDIVCDGNDNCHNFDDEPDPDPTENEIFDEDGNWNSVFLCKIIHVMDKYKISHEALHELRMVCVGYLPPINRIKVEKSKMSTEVKYTNDPRVRFISFLSHFILNCYQLFEINCFN